MEAPYPITAALDVAASSDAYAYDVSSFQACLVSRFAKCILLRCMVCKPKNINKNPQSKQVYGRGCDFHSLVTQIRLVLQKDQAGSPAQCSEA